MNKIWIPGKRGRREQGSEGSRKYNLISQKGVVKPKPKGKPGSDKEVLLLYLMGILLNHFTY